MRRSKQLKFQNQFLKNRCRRELHLLLRKGLSLVNSVASNLQAMRSPVRTIEKYFFGSIACRPISVATAMTVASTTSMIAALRSTSETVPPRPMKPVVATRQAFGVPASRLTVSRARSTLSPSRVISVPPDLSYRRSGPG